METIHVDYSAGDERPIEFLGEEYFWLEGDRTNENITLTVFEDESETADTLFSLVYVKDASGNQITAEYIAGLEKTRCKATPVKTQTADKLLSSKYFMVISAGTTTEIVGYFNLMKGYITDNAGGSIPTVNPSRDLGVFTNGIRPQMTATDDGNHGWDPITGAEVTWDGTRMKWTDGKTNADYQ